MLVHRWCRVMIRSTQRSSMYHYLTPRPLYRGSSSLMWIPLTLEKGGGGPPPPSSVLSCNHHSPHRDSILGSVPIHIYVNCLCKERESNRSRFCHPSLHTPSVPYVIILYFMIKALILLYNHKIWSLTSLLIYKITPIAMHLSI